MAGRRVISASARASHVAGRSGINGTTHSGPPTTPRHEGGTTNNTIPSGLPTGYITSLEQRLLDTETALLATLCSADHAAPEPATLERFAGLMAEMEQSATRAGKLDAWKRFPLASAEGIQSWRREMRGRVDCAVARSGEADGVVRSEIRTSVNDDDEEGNGDGDGSDAGGDGLQYQARPTNLAEATWPAAPMDMSSNMHGALAKIAPLDRSKYF